MTRILSLLIALAITLVASTAQADISWAAGAPGGTGGGSVSFDQTQLDGAGAAINVSLDTGIVSNQVLTRGETTTLDYTISAWVNSDVTTEGWFLGIGGGGGDGRGLHLGFQNGLQGLRQHHWSADSGGATTVAANTWVHATFTYDGDGGSDILDADGNITGTRGLASVYLNGVLDGSTEQNAGFRDGGNIIIGNRRGTTGPGFQGQVDDLAIFTSVLTDSEITAVFNGDAGAYSAAGAYYDFEDDQTGTTALAQGSGLGAATLAGITATAVPEPSSLAIMLGLGVAALARRKRS